MDALEVIAEFLKMEEDAFTLWSDNTVTLKGSDKKEYIISVKRKNYYMEFLGKCKGFYIYSN